LKVETVEQKGDTLRFILHDVETSFANALRRIMMAEVPTMTIDDVFFFDNSSVLGDEFLAHRLGFIPLTTDLDSYVLPEKCECKSDLGCNKCRVILTLEVRAEEEGKTVYSGDLKSENPNVHPVSDKIPIVKLAPKQGLKFEAYARLGQGKTHAKWQPTPEAIYQDLPKVKINEDRCNLCGDCVKSCSRGVLGISDKELRVEKPLDCSLCNLCEEACPMEPPAVRAETVENSFLFTVESTGSLPPERIVSEAAAILAEKLREFGEQLGQL